MNLTIFATPKAFSRHIAIAQRNSIQSWLALRPRPRVILLGDDQGTAETAREFGIEHIAGIECNEFGTPLLSSIFAAAHAAVADGLMLYANADIILTSDVIRALEAVPDGDFLLIGQRTNLYVRYAIDFTDPAWEETMRRRAARNGELWGPKAIDYFAFPHTMFRSVPCFAVGRGWWDHWLVAHALKNGAKVIDATAAVLAIHQNHDFLAGEEALRNLALLGPADRPVTTNLAPFVIKNGRLARRTRSPSQIVRRALKSAFRSVFGAKRAMPS